MISHTAVKEALSHVISRIEGATLKITSPASPSRRFEAVLMLRSSNSAAKIPLLLEIIPQGFPRMLRLACSELKAVLRRSVPEQRSYPVVVAPYITESGMEICREEEVGCIDLSGNCRFAPGQVFVEIQGQKNRFPASRAMKSLFSPKSSRLARVLLSDTRRWWQVQELAAAAQVSIGLASGIRQRLLDEELVLSSGKSVQVHSPQRLLRLWSSHYSYKRSRIREFYTLDRVSQFESKIVGYCKDRGVAYGLGLFSGAARVAPHVRYGRAFVYVMGDLEVVGSDLGLKPVTSGPNVVLLEPFDEGILFGSREFAGARVVSDIQLYLDLIGYEARGEEAAEFLMQEVLEPQWTHP
jgi:hypothetical protein